jgi:hypothetical protein
MTKMKACEIVPSDSQMFEFDTRRAVAAGRLAVAMRCLEAGNVGGWELRDLPFRSGNRGGVRVVYEGRRRLFWPKWTQPMSDFN